MSSNDRYTCKACGRSGLSYIKMTLSPEGKPYKCRECSSEYYKQLRIKNSASFRERDRHLIRKYKYGITKEDYNKRVELQLGGCAICKQPCKAHKNLCVDHNHNTKLIRDLLCNRCNRVLGFVNDDEEILFAMIEYLKRHEEKTA